LTIQNNAGYTRLNGRACSECPAGKYKEGRVREAEGGRERDGERERERERDETRESPAVEERERERERERGAH